VVAALSSVFLQVFENFPRPLPVCEDAGWHRGLVKLVACADDRSVALYKAAISRVGEVWPGAKLEAVDKKDIPCPPRARVRMPATPSDPEQILKLFRVCNPTLPVQDWKVLKTEQTDRPTRLALLLLSSESLRLLAEADYKVSFGFEKVTFHVYRTEVGKAPASGNTGEIGGGAVDGAVSVAAAGAVSAMEPSLELAVIPSFRERAISETSSAEDTWTLTGGCSQETAISAVSLGEPRSMGSVDSLSRLFDKEALLSSDEEADAEADVTMVERDSEHERAADQSSQI